jgi:hypothetical protein
MLGGPQCASYGPILGLNIGPNFAKPQGTSCGPISRLNDGPNSARPQGTTYAIALCGGHISIRPFPQPAFKH